jgi:transposase
VELYDQGNGMNVVDIAAMLRVSRATVYRAVEAARKAEAAKP